jgi:hypothetical protein
LLLPWIRKLDSIDDDDDDDDGEVAASSCFRASAPSRSNASLWAIEIGPSELAMAAPGFFFFFSSSSFSVPRWPPEELSHLPSLWFESEEFLTLILSAGGSMEGPEAESLQMSLWYRLASMG